MRTLTIGGLIAAVATAAALAALCAGLPAA